MTLCWCVFNGIIGQIVTCNIRINFDSGLTYSNNIKCLICGFNKISCLGHQNCSRGKINLDGIKRERDRDRDRDRDRETETVWFGFHFV